MKRKERTSKTNFSKKGLRTKAMISNETEDSKPKQGSMRWRRCIALRGCQKKRCGPRTTEGSSNRCTIHEYVYIKTMGASSSTNQAVNPYEEEMRILRHELAEQEARGDDYYVRR